MASPTSPNFNAQHCPPGAYLSFTCGQFGRRGGIGLELGQPADQDLYIGVKDGPRHEGGELRCLPFYQPVGKAAASAQADEDGAARYDIEKAADAEAGPGAPAIQEQEAQGQSEPITAEALLPEDDGPAPGTVEAEMLKAKLTALSESAIQRSYGWASDRWSCPELQFAVFTPFGPIPPATARQDQSVADALLPAVTAELIVDNTHGDQPKTAFFAIGFHERGLRQLDGLGPDRLGFALRDRLGFAAEIEDDEAGRRLKPFAFMRWTPNEGLAEQENPVHLLGSCPGVGVEVPPGRRCVMRLAIGGYLRGPVTTGLECSYWYTRFFSGLQHVLAEALERFDARRFNAHELDSQLQASGLSEPRQFLIAHATRSYYGSTQLLDLAGQPYWIVNEGEYCMMNTLDLSVDQVFWELRQNPWVVKNLLDNFVRYYSYHDRLRDRESGKLYPGGISFCHDQGVNNQFSPLGRSSYELTNLLGCFSHMTQEQVCNWSLIAACYVAATGDDDWARAQREAITGCLTSLVHRDHPKRSKRNGVMGMDSDRCGPKGQEITTYDSLDESLAQARNNLYLAVKTWASYLGLAMILERLHETTHLELAMTQAQAAADTIAGQVRPEGWLPAVFEQTSPGYDSKILPAAEGLVYPMFWNGCPHGGAGPKQWLDFDGRFGQMLQALRRHTRTLLRDATRGEDGNRFEDGGLKLSSTSNNSWMSKIMIFQAVAEQLFGYDTNDADEAHVYWVSRPESGYWAMSDQILSGIAMGSRYYPRCVTAALWLASVKNLPQPPETTHQGYFDPASWG